MLRDKWHISQDKQVILTVCRLDKNKAVDVLLKALQRLKENNVEVLIVGDGTERKNLEELTVSLKLQNKVTFLGLKNRRELLELYNLSDIFTLTSYSEGLPRVLIEAMACGCIPIVTNVGSISALTVDGYNGFTLPPGNYTALSEKIKNVLDLPDEEREKIQTKARQSVVEKFDGEKIWSLMVETIKASIPTLK
jgi:glycosyltransferase involved in cell wall biosynthesis